jgi:TetR/AcrR family transcriptional regulator
MEIEKGKRARSKKDKLEKAVIIVNTADSLFQTIEYSGITMALVAKEANVAKGTVFNYFNTKEELFLQLADRYFRQIFAQIDIKLDEKEQSGTPENLTDAFVNILISNPSFLKIVVLMDSIIEKNVSKESLEAFKKNLLQMIYATGLKAEQAFLFIPKGEGPRLLLWIYGIVIGFQNLAEPVENAKQVIDSQDMDFFLFSLEKELRQLILQICKGY